MAGVVDEGPAGNGSWFSSAPPHRPGKGLWLWTGAIVFAAANAVLGQNILQNPGFEGGTEGWFIVGPGASIEAVAERPHSGAAAGRVFDRTSQYCGVAQSLLGLMQPGATYQCAAWVRLDHGTSQPISMVIRQTDESNNGKPRFQPLARMIATSNEWTRLSGRFTLDVSGKLADLIFYFEGPADGVDFFLDDVLITPAETVPEQPRPAQVEPSPPRDKAPKRAEGARWKGLPPVFALSVTLVSGILIGLPLGWLLARWRRGKRGGGGPLDQPPTGGEAPPEEGSQQEKMPGDGALTSDASPLSPGAPRSVRRLLWFTLSTSQFHRLKRGVWALSGVLVLLIFGERVVLRNAATNPGFESGIVGWRVHDGYGELTTSSERAHSGRQAAVTTQRPGYWAGPEQSLLRRLRPGRTYVCSAWVRVRNGDEEPVRMVIRQQDGRSRRPYNITSTTASSNSWCFFSGRFEYTAVEPVEELALYFEGPGKRVDLLVDDVRVVPDRFLLLRAPVGSAMAVLGGGLLLGLAGSKPRWSRNCGLGVVFLGLGLLTSWLVDHRLGVVVGRQPDYAKKFLALGFENVEKGDLLEIKGDIHEPTLYQGDGVRIYGNCTTNLAIVAKLAEIYGRVQGKVYFQGQRIKIMPKAELAGGLDSSGYVQRYGVIRSSDSARRSTRERVEIPRLSVIGSSDSDGRSTIVLSDQPFTRSFDAPQAVVSPEEIAAPRNRVPWSPGQAAGAPDTFQAGDMRTAWASQDPDGGPEWARLEYERPVEIAQVRVRETYNPGAIASVAAVLTNGSEVVLWQGVEPKGEAPFESEFNVTNRVVTGTIVIRLDSRRVPGWNEIDAVEVVGRDGSRQWAKSATASSYFGQGRSRDVNTLFRTRGPP